MLIICYDIHNTRNRTKLSKYLEKYGRRLQFSVWEIDQHYSIVNEIKARIANDFRKRLKNKDSILIIPLVPSSQDAIIRYGRTIQEQDRFITICG
jgi:CRISPR-associated protein Cas2